MSLFDIRNISPEDIGDGYTIDPEPESQGILSHEVEALLDQIIPTEDEK